MCMATHTSNVTNLDLITLIKLYFERHPEMKFSLTFRTIPTWEKQEGLEGDRSGG